MKKECILCQNNENIYYGDLIYGEHFCKSCFDKHSCIHCKEMNLKIYFYDNEDEIFRKEPDPELDFSGSKIIINKKVKEVIYFKFSDKKHLFCEHCYKNEDIYNEFDDNLSTNNNEEFDDYNEFDDDDENEDDDDENYNDIYYVRRGKYDMY
jgi:hypothetical protein